MATTPTNGADELYGTSAGELINGLGREPIKDLSFAVS
jgi:hypothetical protein